ncbi:MAG TPA: TlpA disulfide reductase family protein [Saprospiraceae bacterium]|nr:TlpA disulfide reductase family protein [Saprospiraceae bacterium]
MKLISRLFPVLLVIGLLASCQSAPEEEKPLYLTYNTFDEIAPIFNNESDTTYVINFWATWCQPCIEEMPYFEQLHEEFSEDKVRVILVSLDFEKDVEPRLIPFLEEKQLQSDVALLLDGKYNDWIDRVEPTWDGAIPVTLIYKGDEKRFHGKQYANFEQLSAMVKELM